MTLPLRVAEKIIPALEQAAAALSIEETALVALDWMNGRRTPDANQRLTGAITGIRLGTDAPRIYRSLVEATAFGSRAIVERFRAQGIRIDSAIAIGGVAKKSRFVMQTIADVMNMEVTVAAGDQTVALGAAMFAATAAGLYRQSTRLNERCRPAPSRSTGPIQTARSATTVSTRTIWRSARLWRASSGASHHQRGKCKHERYKHPRSLVLDRQPGAVRSGDVEQGRGALPRDRGVSRRHATRSSGVEAHAQGARRHLRRCAWKPTRHRHASA